MNSPLELAVLLDEVRSLPEPRGALVTLTRTSGSSFRRAGARMLVLPDGRRIRNLAGGCPDRDITAHAMQVVANDQARLVHYSREQNFDAMLETGCNGELEVLIEPLAPQHASLAKLLHVRLQQRQTTILATVHANGGRCLPHPQRMLLAQDSPDCPISDDIRDTALRSALLERCATLSLSSQADSESIVVAGEHYSVRIEVLHPPYAAYLFGLNTTSQALARLLLTLGWSITLIALHTDTLETTTSVDLPIRTLTPDQLDQLGTLDCRCFAVVITHSLEQDLAYLRSLSRWPLRYVASIGARQRASQLRAALPAARPLYAPAGLDIGAETPEEIALSIAAEMLAVANGHSGAFLSTGDAPLHRP